MNPENQLIFPPDINTVVAQHNVVGQGGVLETAQEELQEFVGGHYDPRSADHFPYAQNGQTVYVLAKNLNSIQPHLNYRAEIAGLPMQAIGTFGEIGERNASQALFLPYIRLDDDMLPNSIEWTSYGLPPEVTRRLKNKAAFHETLAQTELAPYVPNFVICNVDAVTKKGFGMLTKIEQMYRDAKIHHEYPLGLMIRAAESDGNYGSGYVKQLTESKRINGTRVTNGSIVFIPNGQAKNFNKDLIFDKWKDALYTAANHVSQNMDTTVEPRVVMTRLLDLEASPGMSATLVSGVLHCMEWNGQYVAPGDTAATGTSTFPNKELKEEYRNQSHELLRQIIDLHLYERFNRNEIYAMFNIDLMIVGPLEKKLWENVNRDTTLQKYVDAGHNENYRSQAYDPRLLKVAEINPRDTNWTLAVKAVAAALHRQLTVQELTNLVRGNETRILARDAWSIPNGMTMDQVREILLDLHCQLTKQGKGGIILRMPDNPAGVITYSHEGTPDQLLQIAHERLISAD